MVTKAVLDRAQVVVICPDWGQTGEAAARRPFLDRMMTVRVPIPDVPLYLPDGATNPLPARRWGSIASLIDGNDCDISLDELNPQVVKFLHRVNRGLPQLDFLKRYRHDTPAATPKDECKVPEIHPATESDEEQHAGVRDAEVDKVDIQWEEVGEEPAEVQWDEVSEDGYLADLNIAQPLKYDPFPSIHEDYSDRIEDLLNEVDLQDSVLGGVQNFTMTCLALYAMQEYGVTMQVEEDKARIANPRGWQVSKDDLSSLKEDIELRIFQISEEQQRLELKDRSKSHYNKFTGRSIDGDETDLFYQYLDDDRFIVDGNDVYLDVSALLSECYSVSRDEYGKSNLAAADDFEEKIKNLPSKIQEVLRRKKVAFGPLMAHGSCEKLVTMDLELMDEHKNTTVRSKPFPASNTDSEEMMRQISECIAADIAEKYEQAEYPKHSSPFFLVEKPGSNAKRLVVHFGKLNKLTKKHLGSPPSLEQALERAAYCRFKSKLDKRSGFWQVELTKCAQDLSAFIAPIGQVFNWKVMPFGLTNAPATFQEVMNQVVARMKLKPTVQALLKKGAVIEVYIDDVLLGTDDADDHLRLVEELLRTCEECNIRVKLEKCEFMQEEIEYSGFRVGWRCWRPVKKKIAPILKASIRDDKTRGVKDIRAFLGSCNFYRRHISTFTYSSHLLTDWTKKTVPWKWTPEHEAQFQEIKEKLSSLRLLGTPASDGKFVVITDASLVGGGGTLLQWHRIPGAAARRIADELRTVGVNRDGSLKHNYDFQEFHLVPIGHWNWKWSSTRGGYSTYEGELLSGILLMSGQSPLFGGNSLVWLCDQESTETFLKGALLKSKSSDVGGRFWLAEAQHLQGTRFEN